MATKNKKTIQNEHSAKASAQNISVSTKHCIEISSKLRYKTVAQAKKILEDVITMKIPIPFNRFKRAMGHKPGMAAGRFPKKAAGEVLKLVKSVESNAQSKGLNTSHLKIIKILANKAPNPMTGGRQRTGTKRTHVEIEVKETKEKKNIRKSKKEASKEKTAGKGKKENTTVEEKTEPLKDEKSTEELKKEIVKPTEEKTIIDESKSEVKEELTGEQAK